MINKHMVLILFNVAFRVPVLQFTHFRRVL